MPLGLRTQATHQIPNHLRSEFPSTYGRTVSLFVETLRYVSRGEPLRCQSADVFTKLGVVAQLLQLGHGPHHNVFGSGGARPFEAHSDPLALAFDLNHGLFENLADYLLAVLVSGGGGSP
jgi:hypothetical protein